MVNETLVATCFVCDKIVGERKSDGLLYMNGGTVWSSSGNYGSTVFDMHPGRVNMFLCDECLREKADRTHTVMERQTTEIRAVRGMFPPECDGACDGCEVGRECPDPF